MRIFLVAFLFIFQASFCLADITLEPIVKDASPLDFLAQDPIVPVQSGTPIMDSSAGSLQHTFTNELPYSSTDPGQPGALSQFRGLGRSSDETNVETLGIPLNGPQGGGFDFSTFPQFFWADYRFQAGPSSASFDPRGISGTLSIVPWTAQAIEGPDSLPSGNRVSALYSSANLQQVSVGANYQDRAAILLGNSSGLANGPSASISAKLYEDSRLSVRFHLLETEIAAEIDDNPPEPIAAHQTSLRTIPVMQIDWKLTADVLVKSSIFYDNAYLRFDDPSLSSFTKERAQQFGVEDAVFVGGWKFGINSREVFYNTQVSGSPDFTAPDENISSFQVARLFILAGTTGSQLLLEPTIQVVNVSDFGFYPEGTLGLRQEWDDSRSAVYVKGNFSRRFPSVVDRYYNIPASGFYPAEVGNPNLQPEKDATSIVGVETRRENWDASLQGYYQIRYSAEIADDISTGDTFINSDTARLYSLVANLGWKPIEPVRFYESANFTQSRVEALSSPFPYIPKFIDLLGMGVTLSPRLTADFQGRIQSSAYVSVTSQIDPSAYLDVGATYALSDRLKLLGRIEDITNAQLAFEPFTPPKGRVFSVAMVGSI